MNIFFFCPGKPAPAGSKRAFIIKSKQTGKPRAIVTDANPKARDWKIDVQHSARAVHTGKPLLGALSLTLVFYIQRPKGHYGTGKNGLVLRVSAPPYPVSKPDATKLCRGVEDALTGICWADDSQVVDQQILKRYDTAHPTGAGQGVAVTVREIS